MLGKKANVIPTCSKFFKKIDFGHLLYAFHSKNQLISENQSGFRPRDGTIKQLIFLHTTIHVFFEDKSSIQVRA